jgi:hypothetical protein
MEIKIRFITKSWVFTVFELSLLRTKFIFNLLELDILRQEEPISLLTIIKNSTYTRIEFFKYNKTIKNK